MDLDSSHKTNIIRPLNSLEAARFLEDYKKIFFQSSGKQNEQNEELYRKISNLSYVQNQIDPTCIIKIDKRLVRIEYPGKVTNVVKAIETLGGINSIETVRSRY